MCQKRTTRPELVSLWCVFSRLSLSATAWCTKLLLTLSRPTSDPLSPSLFAVHFLPFLTPLQEHTSYRCRVAQYTVNRQCGAVCRPNNRLVEVLQHQQSGVVAGGPSWRCCWRLAASRIPKRCWCPRTELNGWVSHILCGLEAGMEEGFEVFPD